MFIHSLFPCNFWHLSYCGSSPTGEGNMSSKKWCLGSHEWLHVMVFDLNTAIDVPNTITSEQDLKQRSVRDMQAQTHDLRRKGVLERSKQTTTKINLTDMTNWWFANLNETGRATHSKETAKLVISRFSFTSATDVNTFAGLADERLTMYTTNFS